MEETTQPTVKDAIEETGMSAEDKKKQAVLSLLQKRIKSAKKFWDPYHKEWKVIRDFQMVNRNRESQDLEAGAMIKPEFQVAYSFSTAEAVESSIFDQPPTWVARPRLGMSRRSPNYNETLKAIPKALDYIWDDNELTERTDAVVHTFVGYGLGGYKIAIRDATKRVPVKKDPIKFMGIPILPEREVMETQGEAKAKLVYSVINPFRFFVAPESKSLDRWDDIPWCFESFTEEIDDAKEMLGSEDVHPTGKRDMGTDSTQNDRGIDRDKIDFAQDTVDFFEYYGFLPASVIGKEGAGHRWHVKLTEKKIYLLEPIYHRDGEPPFEIAANYVGLPTDTLGMVIPFGEIKPIYHLEEEMSESRASMVTHRKRSSRAKIILPTGAEVDEDALKSAEQDAIVRTDDPQAVKYLEPSPFDQTIVAHVNMTRQDISVVSGTDDLNRGATSDQTIKTATGQRLLEAARSRRAKRKYRKISQLIERLGVKTLNRLAQYSPVIWYENDFAPDADTPNDPATGMPIQQEDQGQIDLREMTDPETGLINMVIKVKAGSQSSVERDVLREQHRELYIDTILPDQTIAPESKQMILRSLWRNYDLEQADQIKFLPQQVSAVDPVTGQPVPIADGGPITPPAVNPQVPVNTPVEPGPAGAENLPPVPGMDQSGRVEEGV